MGNGGGAATRAAAGDNSSARPLSARAAADCRALPLLLLVSSLGLPCQAASAGSAPFSAAQSEPSAAQRQAGGLIVSPRADVGQKGGKQGLWQLLARMMSRLPARRALGAADAWSPSAPPHPWPHLAALEQSLALGGSANGRMRIKRQAVKANNDQRCSASRRGGTWSRRSGRGMEAIWNAAYAYAA